MITVEKYIPLINSLPSLFPNLFLVLSGSIALRLQRIKTRNEISDVDLYVLGGDWKEYEKDILPFFEKYKLWLDFHNSHVIKYPLVYNERVDFPMMDYRDLIQAKEERKHLIKQKQDLEWIYENNPSINFLQFIPLKFL